MGKFFITNSHDLYCRLNDIIKKTDFQKSFDYESSPIYAIGLHKLRIKNANAVRCEDDFCIATGTCIYKESLDYAQLLSSFEGNIINAREESLGQYAVSIKKGNELTVYGDACACYDIYYYIEKKQDSDTWLISNSLYDMACVLKENLRLNDFSLVERTIHRALLGGSTFFDEIHRLRGREYIKVDLRNNFIRIIGLPVEYPVSEDFAKTVKETAEILCNNARIAAKVLGTPTLCITGGLDSRLILSAFLAAGVKPKLFHGLGNNKVTSPRKEDEICAENLSKTFGLDLEKGDFSVSSPLDKDWNSLINNNGFTTAFIWGGQKNVIQSLVNSGDLLLFGWGGELYRNIDGWTENNNRDNISVKELLKKWYFRKPSVPLARSAIANYDEVVLEHVVEECKYLSLNPDKMAIDDSFFIELSYQSMAGTQIPSFIQQYKYSYLLLFEYGTLSKRVTHSEKDSAKFMLAVINTLYPQILDVALFTHQRWRILEKNTMTLTPVEMPIKKAQPKGIKILKKYIPNMILGYIRSLKRRMSIGQKSPEQAPECKFRKFDKLKSSTLKVNFSDVRRSEDTLMYAILLRAHKILGF